MGPKDQGKNNHFEIKFLDRPGERKRGQNFVKIITAKDHISQLPIKSQFSLKSLLKILNSIFVYTIFGFDYVLLR